jgi:protein-S-isoprenylcysteine O-methyltransferase Ste14
VLAGIHELFNNAGIRAFMMKARRPAGLLVLLGALVIIKRDWFWAGMAVAAVGEALQVWCFSSLHKEAEVSFNGPYSVVRNPMYLARFLLLFGVFMWFRNPWVLGVYTVIYYFYMVNRVRREEKTLTGLLGEPYVEYTKTINRFLPGLRPYPGSRFFYFNAAFFKKNHALSNAVACAIFFALAWVSTYVVDLPGRVLG